MKSRLGSSAPSERCTASRAARRFALAAVAFIALFGLLTTVDAGKYTYPPARMGDVVDNYHGTMVPDPYRWMEDPDAEETIVWVNAENELTHEYIYSSPVREKLEQRLTELWNYPKYSLPFKQGDRYFFSKNDGLQNQSVIYMQQSLDAEPVVVIDPNTLSEDGTIALSNQAYSEDGTLMAYGLSASGSDQQEIYVRNLDTMKDYPDHLKWCKFSSIAWKHDNSGFYFNRYPAEGTVPDEDLSNYNRVYWHALGTDQSQDVLVYEDPANKEYSFSPGITDDGKYLFLFSYHGTDDRNGVMWREVESAEPFRVLMNLGEAEYSPIDNAGTVAFFSTNLDAPKRKIIAVDLANPAKENWKTLIPEQEDVIDFATMVNNCFVVGYMKDAHHVLKIFAMDGAFLREIALPTIGTVAGLSGKREDTEMFFGFMSFTYPFTAFRYDFNTDKVAIFRRSDIKFDPSAFETKEVFTTSKDGTKVPVFITHKKGLKLDGDRPVILYGYGGFNMSMAPFFTLTTIPWMENGGVFAVACIRGGDEYGEEWHTAGMLEKRQNVFDDFIGSAEWLVKKKYTNPKRLAIMGGSNGGLLVSVVMLQRPDLFGAVVSQVPVTDMLRYHKFTVGRFWVPEFGNAEENPEHFKFLYAYSPLHNVKPGYPCPPILVTTADTDDRVAPLHSKKFTAMLQANSAGDNPILIRVETKAGHGGGKPTSKRIEEYADTYTFLFKTFGMTM